MKIRQLLACTVVVGLAAPSTAQGKVAALMEDHTAILNVPGDARVSPNGWSDSYSVGNSCYCETTFDHNIDVVVVATPLGNLTVKEVCTLLGPGPGSSGRPIYNDIQCGNGPANDAGDETVCPGRVDHGPNGCKYIGPKWNFSQLKAPIRTPTKAPAKSPVTAPNHSPTKAPNHSPTMAPVQATVPPPVASPPSLSQAPMTLSPLSPTRQSRSPRFCRILPKLMVRVFSRCRR
jgi:hypothetical protein